MLCHGKIIIEITQKNQTKGTFCENAERVFGGERGLMIPDPSNATHTDWTEKFEYQNNRRHFGCV